MVQINNFKAFLPFPEKDYGAITEDWMSVDYLNTLYENSQKSMKELEGEKNG